MVGVIDERLRQNKPGRTRIRIRLHYDERSDVDLAQALESGRKQQAALLLAENHRSIASLQLPRSTQYQQQQHSQHD